MKNLFKSVSLIMVVSMVLTLFSGVSVMAKPNSSETVMPVVSEFANVDFSNNTESEIAIAANNQYGTGSAPLKTVGVGSVPPVITTSGEMKFSPVSGCKAQFQDITGVSYTESAVYEFSFMMTAWPAGTFEVINGRDRDGNYVAYRLYVKNNGAVGVGSEGCAVSTGAVVIPGKWCTVKFAANMDTQTYNCYINGKLEAENLKFKGFADGNTVTNIGRPFVFLEKAGMGSFDIYYDNLKIYKEPVGRRTITADDFSAYSADVNYTVKVSDSFAGLRIIDTSGAQPVGIKVNSSNERIETNGAAILTAYGPTDVKKLATEFDFTPTVTGVDQGKIFSTVDQGANAFGIEIYLNSNNQFVASCENGDVVLLSDVKANETYSFKVYTDLTKTFDSNYSGTIVNRPGMYDVYINGKCAGAGLKFKYTNKNFASLTNLGRVFGISTNAASSAIYYDNVAIYTDVREEVLSAAANALYANLDGKMLKAKELVLPSSSQSGYNLTWTSSDEAVINTQTGEVVHSEDEKTVVLTATVTDAANQYSVSGEYEVVVTSSLDVRKYYLNESFDNAQAIAKGDIVGDFKVVSCTSGISLGETDGNKYMVVDSSETGTAIYQADIQVTKPDKVVLEFDFMQPEKGGIVQITSPHNAGGMDSISEIYSDGKDILYREGELKSFNDKGYVLVENYEAGKWYNFKIYHNITDKEFEIYVDDVCCANHEPFRQTYTTYDQENKLIINENKDYAKYPAAFSRLRFGLSEKGITKFYVDNVKIYTSENMDELYKFGKVNEDMTYAEPLVLPAETTDGKAIQWTSSTHEITDNTITVAKSDGKVNIQLSATAGDLIKNYIINVGAPEGIQLSADEEKVVGEIYYDDKAIAGKATVLVTVVYDETNAIKGLELGTLNDKYITAEINVSELPAGTYTTKSFVITSFSELKPLAYADGELVVAE